MSGAAAPFVNIFYSAFRIKIKTTNPTFTHPTYRLLASVAMGSKILIEVLFTVKLSSFFNEALVLK